MELTQTVGYRQLLEEISGPYTYWQVGQYLRAEYGKSFNRCNLIYMRLFYLCYPISVKPSHQLSCSHQIELLKLGVGLGGTRQIPSRDRQGAVRNPQVPQKPSTLTARVNEHLKKMGASWN